MSCIAPKDDHIADISTKGSSLLPRIHQSLILNLGDFVTHDYCQQLVRKAYFGDSALKKRTGVAFFFQVVFQLFIATPIGWVLNFLSKLKIPLCSNMPVCLNMDIPVNMLVSHVLIQITFVVVILIVLINPNDIQCELDFNLYNALCLAMAVGQLLSNVEEMFQQARCVRIFDHMKWYNIVYARFKRFFSNRYYNYRLLGLISFVTGAGMRGVGFKFFTKHICLESNGTFYHVIDDNYSSYKGGVVEVGTCLQGISVIIILSQLLQFLRLHPRVSAMFEGMLKCIWDVFSYGCTYTIITLTFSAGIYFLLPNASTQCNTGGKLARAKEIYESCINPPNLEDNLLSYDFKTDTNCSAKTDSTIFMKYSATIDTKNQNSSDKCAHRQLLFTSYHDTTKYLFLQVFSPMMSVFDEIECMCGISRDVGLAMWYLYYFLVIVVLVNLLIALMSKTVNDIESVDTWIYHRTLLRMRFCKNNAVVLPPPMNLIQYMLTQVMVSPASSVMKRYKYKRLIQELVTRYDNDMVSKYL